MSVKFWRINKEEIISKIRAWAETLSNDPNVVCVVLFGSLARGDFTASSDADVLIILRTSEKRFDERIPDFLPSGIGIGVDVFPYTIDEAKRALVEGFGVVEVAFREGMWLLDKEGLKNQWGGQKEMGRKLIIEIPEDIFISLGKTSKELVKEIKLIMAFKFFGDGKLSICEAAKFARVNKWTFLEELGKKGSSVFNYIPEELERDLEDIEKARKVREKE